MAEIKKMVFDNHQEWLKERMSSIGASSIGTILGVNKYETPAELASRMKQQLSGVVFEETDNLAIRRGHAYEGGVAQMWAEELHKSIIGTSAKEYLCRRADIPFMHASPDRTYWIDDSGVKSGKNAEANKGVLECKTTRKPIDPDDLPASWQLQLQVQMGICGYNEGYIAYDVLTSPDGFGFRKFNFDPEIFDSIVKVCKHFWESYVIGDETPQPASGSDVLHLFPQSTAKVVTAPDHVAEAVRQLKDSKEAVKVLEEQQEALEVEIKNAIGDADTLMYDGAVLATWKSSKPSMRFDSARFKAEHPDLYSEYCNEVAGTRRFLLK